ncbi:MAG TPA: tetratricopeptide repeat protein [Bryobacteraceae bacterium]|jgi:tetratricopeptide (TPR) repeat protein|nr:tetratricopeptide repeat protein [Bryobacteraceae bacterium]
MKIPCVLVSAVLAALLLPAQAPVPRGTTTNPGTSTTGNSGSGGVVLPNIPTNLPPTPTSMNPDVNGRGAFFYGKVAMSDGTALPYQVVIERVCGGSARRQAYADSKGDFSFQVGETQDLMADATSSSADGMGSNRGSTQSNTTPFACDLRASLPGYRSDLISLSTRRNLDNPNVGTIFLHRLAHVEGLTTSATAVLAPKDARRAFEKGLEAAKKGKVDEAQADYQRATELYPRYAYAWFELGRIYEQREHIGEGRDAYLKSIAADSKFVNPYERLYLLSLKQQNWEEVAQTTEKIMRLNPYDFPKAVYYNAVANFQLGNFDVALKSAREAASIDSASQNPRIHYVLGVILANKQDLKGAADCLRVYLKSDNILDRDSATKMLADIEQQAQAMAKP